MDDNVDYTATHAAACTIIKHIEFFIKHIDHIGHIDCLKSSIYVSYVVYVFKKYYVFKKILCV